jgi:hypothetical protein
LNSTLRRSGTRLRPSVQEERILQLADWIAEETEAAKPAKETVPAADPQQVQ